MTKKGRPIVYQNEDEKPITVSLRIPRGLAEQMKRYAYTYRQSVTELLLDGLQWRLEQQGALHESLDYSNTELQELLKPVYAVDDMLPFDEDLAVGCTTLLDGTQENTEKPNTPPPPHGRTPRTNRARIRTTKAATATAPAAVPVQAPGAEAVSGMAPATKTCGRGHTFDAARHKECPECHKLRSQRYRRKKAAATAPDPDSGA